MGWGGWGGTAFPRPGAYPRILQSLKGTAVITQDPPAGHALTHISILSPGASIWKSPDWETWRQFSPLWFNTQYFSFGLPSSFSLPTSPRFIKLQKSFVWDSLNNEMTSMSMLIQLTLDLCTFPMGGKLQGEVSAFSDFSVLLVLLHQAIKGFTVPSILVCYFTFLKSWSWLLQQLTAQLSLAQLNSCQWLAWNS